MAKAKSRRQRLEDLQATVSSAKQDAEELLEEMENWRDSIPENLQGGQKYQEVEDACGQLETLIDYLDEAETADVEFPRMF